MSVTDLKGPLVGIRHLQAFLIFLNIVVVYISRLNVSVAIVAMTNAETTNPDFPEYDWSEKEKSYILSSFYWGYVLTQFPGGYLCRHFGAKITMLLSTLGSGVFSLITPFCIPWGGWKIFCLVRIVQGLFQGMIFPCIHEHLAKWSPNHERNRLGALSHTGIECGTVMAMGVSGLIAHSSMGWPGISYVSAGLCFIWCLLWLVFSSNNPPASRFISTKERDYIETSMRREEDFHKQKIPIPWVAIFTSVPFNALLIVRCAQSWGFNTMQMEIPSYLNGVLDMDIKSNSLYSALPYITMWVLSYVYLISSDVLLKKKVLSLTVIRKSINTIALWVPAAMLIGVGFLGAEHMTWAIVCLTIGVGVNGGSTIGSSLNSMDLSPNHAGILMGIINTIANFVPIVTPLIAGVIVTNKHERTQWQLVFIIAACVFFFGNLIYIIWGTAEPQPWNEVDFLVKEDPEKSSVEKSPEQSKPTIKFIGELADKVEERNVSGAVNEKEEGTQENNQAETPNKF